VVGGFIAGQLEYAGIMEVKKSGWWFRPTPLKNIRGCFAWKKLL